MNDQQNGHRARLSCTRGAGHPLLSGVIPEIPLDEVVECYRKGEWGDALLFAQAFDGQCVYDHLEKAWYLWQGHYWQRDDQGRVRALVSGLLASLYLHAAADLALQAGKG
jgi:hypothetical protein